jgi:3-hydroxyisobutyrate dehydrogenase-like beta-hydroxyacid dehydrogenase
VAQVLGGIDAATIVNVFNEAALEQMMSLKVRLPATYLRGDFDPRFSLALAHTDLGVAQELARATGTSMPLSPLCETEMIEGDGPRLGRPRRLDLPDPARGARKDSGACRPPER